MHYILLMNAREEPTRYLTVRNLPPRVAEALDAEKRRREISLNQTVIELLQSGLGMDVTGAPHNGLKRLAGVWTAEELAEFERSVAPAEQVDPGLWE